VLVARHWRRSALVAGRSTGGKLGRGAGLLLRTIFFGYAIQMGLSLGASIHKLPREDRPAALGMSLLGVALMGFSAGLLSLAPGFRGRATPLRSPLLLTLPTRLAARLFLSFAELIALVVVPVAYLWAAVPSRPFAAAVVGSAVFGTAFLWGVVALRSGSIRLSPLLVARGAQLGGILLMLGGYGLLMVAAVAHSVFSAWPQVPLAASLVQRRSILPGLLQLTALCFAAGFALWILERTGIEELDATPIKAAKNDGRTMTLAGTERLMSWRESGLRMLLFGVAIPTGFLAWLLYTLRQHPKFEQVAPLLLERTVGFLVVHMGATLVLARASRAADRDSRASPFLASLPIDPADTLRGKVGALDPFALAPLLAFVPLGLFAPSLALVCRAAACCVGLLLLARAAPAVSFLTYGLGTPSARSLGTSANLASLLIRFPLLLVALTDSPFAAVLALATLAAVGFEARRAGALCVRWLDDAGDDLARETPVWPALLTLAAFFALQSATLQFAATLLPGLPLSLQIAAGYAVSGTALILMTIVGRRGLPTLRFFPERAAWLVAGSLVGIGSGVLAWGYSTLMRHFEVDVKESIFDGGPSLALGLMAIVAAPLAEETFFRGWLQEAIGVELPARWRGWAFVISAFAFAAVHPAQGFPVIFAFGLGAGFLYRRSGALLPGMIAHATHNAMAIFLGAG
jgi:membrane protease YdiL (CAAX protease family)